MSTEKKFSKLLEPGLIGKVKTRNRIIKTGASMLYWQGNETSMNDYTLGYYDALARGGVGLLIVESPIIDYPTGGRWPERYRFDDDKYLPGMKQLVDTIHKHDCPTFMQMNHDGPWQNPLFPGVGPLFDGPPIGASPVCLPGEMGDFHNDEPRELSIEEIEIIADKTAAAAVRAQEAGFDGIDINTSSSHLFHNFLSPYWNRRTDAYGGSVENRTRLLSGIIREIKKRAGADFPINICINGIEIGQAIGIPNDQCLTHEESKQAVQIFQEAGADSFMIRSQWLGYHVGGFLPEQLFFPDLPVPMKEAPKEYNLTDHGRGANVFMADAIKKITSVPIIVVGRIDAPLGEKILARGSADFIAMHRPMMADPEYPNKVAAGRIDEAAPCTRCGTCLDEGVQRHRRCRINPFLGEKKYEVEPAGKKKKVVIVGGGPGGMEAALISKLRGHDVTLIEKSSRLGGLMPVAEIVKGTEIEELSSITKYFTARFKALGVEIRPKEEVTPDSIAEMNPDAVIIAAGGTVYAPDIPGMDNKNVITAPELHKQLKTLLKVTSSNKLRALTKLYLPVGKRAVIIGSGVYGLETAEFLIKRGRKITIVDTAEEPGIGMLDYRMGLIMPWLERKGVPVLTGCKDIKITPRGVELTTADGEARAIAADTVLPVTKPKPNMELYEQLKGKIPELYAVGDCSDPSMIVDAIRTGWSVAKEI